MQTTNRMAMEEDIQNFPTSFGKETIVEFGRTTVFARGGFGEVSLGMHKEASQLVAIKTLCNILEVAEPSSSHTKMMVREDIVSEIAALNELCSHENIINLEAVYQSHDQFEIGLNLVLEYCPVDLYLSLEWRRKTLQPLLSFDCIRTILRDVFSALAWCHSKHYLHRDVTPANLLVSSTGCIKLCDFGLVTKWEDSHSVNNTSVRSTGDRALCTLFYRSPEMLLQGQAGDHPSIDIYAAGVIMAELIAGTLLFPGVNVLDQITRVFEVLGTPSEQMDFAKECQLKFEPKVARDWREVIPRLNECSDATGLLQQCLILDPSRRAEAASALRHPFLQNFPRSRLQYELIPKELDEPFLFASGNFKVAKQQATETAAKRKTFLAQLDSWSKDV